MGEKLGLILRVGRLITLPEAVDKLEAKVDKIHEVQTTCVTDDELETRLDTHKEAQDEKLDMIIDLLRGNDR